MIDKAKWLRDCSLLVCSKKERLDRPYFSGIICRKDWHGTSNGQIAAFINSPIDGLEFPEDTESILLGDGEILSGFCCPDLSKVVPNDNLLSSARNGTINWEGINHKKKTCHRLEFMVGNILLKIYSNGGLLKGGIKVGEYTPATSGDFSHLFDANLFFSVIGGISTGWKIMFGEKGHASKIIWETLPNACGVIAPIQTEG